MRSRQRVRLFIGLAGLLVLFASGIAVASIMYVAVSERQREIGSLRVLGYFPSQITRIFSGESLLLSAFGILLGAAGGVGLAHLVAWAYNTELYRFPAVIYPSRLLASAGLMIVFVVSAQLIVYRLVCRLAWLEALKVKE